MANWHRVATLARKPTVLAMLAGTGLSWVYFPFPDRLSSFAMAREMRE